VRGLSAADFFVSADNLTLSVVQAQPATDPLALILVGESLPSDPAFLRVREVLRSIVDTVGDRSPATRIAFASAAEPPELLGVATDRQALESTARNFLPSPDATALFRGIIIASRALGRQSTNRRAVLAIASHRGFDKETVPATDLGNALYHARSALWAVELLWPGAAQMDSPEEPAALAFATAFSGGMHLTTYNVASLRKAADTAIDLLLSEYHITYLVPEPVPQALRIGVRLKGVRIVAPVWGRSPSPTPGLSSPAAEGGAK
jgi:hypothetical protein